MWIRTLGLLFCQNFLMCWICLTRAAMPSFCLPSTMSRPLWSLSMATSSEELRSALASKFSSFITDSRLLSDAGGCLVGELAPERRELGRVPKLMLEETLLFLADLLSKSLGT